MLDWKSSGADALSSVWIEMLNRGVGTAASEMQEHDSSPVSEKEQLHLNMKFLVTYLH